MIGVIIHIKLEIRFKNMNMIAVLALGELLKSQYSVCSLVIDKSIDDNKVKRSATTNDQDPCRRKSSSSGCDDSSNIKHCSVYSMLAGVSRKAEKSRKLDV